MVKETLLPIANWIEIFHIRADQIELMALGIDINANPIFNYVHNNIFNTMPRFQLFVICFVLL